MTARELARRAFWSEHSLCAIYMLAHGHWDASTFQPTNTFSLRQLIAFAESLPQHVIDALSDEGQS